MSKLTKLSIAFATSLLLIGSLQAQNASKASAFLPKTGANERCRTDHRHEYLMQTDPQYVARRQQIEQHVQQVVQNQKNDPNAKAATVYSVPVVVHIMERGDSQEDITDAQVISAIDNLTDAYGAANTGTDTDIEFCLAVRDPNGNPTSGIVRVDASGVSSGGDSYATKGITDNNETAVKALSKWDNTKYYNFWIVSEIDDNNGGSGTQGYAYFPGAGSAVDGAVVMYNSFGYDPTGSIGYNLKSYTRHNATTVHEMGHGLNLYHTFQGDNNGASCPSNSGCGSGSDCCADTDPHNRNDGDCGDTGNTCFGGGTDLADIVTNIMAYSSDQCQTKFSADQSARMRAVLGPGGTRESLTTSDGCTPAAPPVSDFYADGTTACTNVPINFYDNSQNGTSGWSWTFQNGTPSTSSVENPSITWASGGVYDVSLTASNGVGAGNTETKADYITVYNGGATYCTMTSVNQGNYDLGVDSVLFNTISNGNSAVDQNTSDFTCTHVTELDANTGYVLNVYTGDNFGGVSGARLKVYIDYDGNGTYNETNELVFDNTTLATLHSTTITTPSSGIQYDQVLGMRIITWLNTSADACDSDYGEAEDYGVYFATPPCTPPTVTSNPNNSTICEGANTSFSITASDATGYQWQVDNGGGFTNMVNNSVYSGVTTASMSITAATSGMDGNLYRCIASGACSPNDTSASASLFVNPLPGNAGTISGAQVLCNGNTNAFSINTVADATGYTWSIVGGASISGGQGSNSISVSAASSDYTVTVTPTNSCGNGGSNNLSVAVAPVAVVDSVFKDTCGVPGGVITDTILAVSGCDSLYRTTVWTEVPLVSVTSDPNNSTICEGSNTSFAITADNASSYQWQVDNGGGYVNMINNSVYSGVNTANLSVTGALATMDGNLYRCVVSNSCGSETSNNATLIVEAQPVADAGSGDTTVCGSTIDLNGSIQNATGGEWTSSGTGVFSPNPTTLTASYVFGASDTSNGSVVLTLTSTGNGTCSADVDQFTVIINQTPTVTSHPSDATIDENTNTSFSVTATDASSYQWQVDNGGGFTNMINNSVYSGVTTSTMSITSAQLSMSGNLYRCVVTNNCGTATSNDALLTVNSVSGSSFVTSPANGKTGSKNWPRVRVNPVGGASTYTVELSRDPAFGSIDFTKTSSNPNNVQFGNLAYGVTYYTRVKTDIDGYGAVTSFTTDPEPVVWLSNPTAGSNNVTLDQLMYSTWLPNDIVSVDFEFNTKSWFDPNQAIVVNASAANNGAITNWNGSVGLAPNTTYYVRMRAHTDTITSTGWGIKKYFTTENVPAGSYVTAPADGSTGLKTWNDFSVLAVNGASTYTLEVSTDPGFASIFKSKTSSTTSFAMGGLEYGTLYYARVTTDLGGYGATTTLSTYASPEMYMTYPGNGSSGITLSDKASCNWPDTETNRIVYEFNTQSDFSGQSLFDTNTTVYLNKKLRASNKFSDIGLQASTTYYVRVKADADSLGVIGSFGPVRSFTTGAARPMARVSAEDENIEEELVADIDNTSYYNVYPNPFSDQINIRVDSKKQENLMIRISDLTGKVVYQSTRHQTNQTCTIGEDLEDGMYLIQLVHGDKTELVKAIKK